MCLLLAVQLFEQQACGQVVVAAYESHDVSWVDVRRETVDVIVDAKLTRLNWI